MHNAVELGIWFSRGEKLAGMDGYGWSMVSVGRRERMEDGYRIVTNVLSSTFMTSTVLGILKSAG